MIAGLALIPALVILVGSVMGVLFVGWVAYILYLIWSSK